MKEIEQPIKQPVKAEETTKELPKVEQKYQELINLQYVQDAKTRKELVEIIDELSKNPELKLEKTANHDLSAKYKGRTLVKICPLKKGWSASLNGSKIQQYTKEQVVSSIRVQQALEKHPIPKNHEDKKVIEKLEERIAKKDKKSKGINVKGIKVTSGVKEWVKTKGYTIEGSTLLVNS